MFPDSINSLAYDTELNLIFTGTKNGKIKVFDDNKLSLISSLNVHDGIIESISICTKRKIIATLGADRSISIYKYNNSGVDFCKILYKRTRDLGLDDYELINSGSQAIDIHPEKDIVTTRSGNSTVIEVDFDGNVKSKVRAFSSDVATVKYSNNGKYLLAGSTSGHIALISDGELKEELIPEGIHETFHWFEQISENEFIAACDARKLIKVIISANSKIEYGIGELFTKDDLEHVAFNELDNNVLASSFDRNIYSIDKDTMKCLSVAFKAPYKVRWVRHSKTEENIAYAQIRDGSLIKFDYVTGERKAISKETPPAIWSVVTYDDFSLLSGEEGLVIKSEKKLSLNENVSFTCLHKFDIGDGYFKRIEKGRNNEFFAGSTSGYGYWADDENIIRKYEFSSAVRDVCYSESKNSFFVSLENGHVLNITKDYEVIIFESSEPVWSISLSPNEEILAVAERIGEVYLLDSQSYQVIESSFSRLPKRMKWTDNQTLYMTHSEKLNKIFFDGESWCHDGEFIDVNCNTVEDFYFWKDYVIFITYGNRLWLADKSNGIVLDSSYYGGEYMKSIYSPEDGIFSIVGRSGTVKSYTIHNEQLLPINEVNINI